MAWRFGGATRLLRFGKKLGVGIWVLGSGTASYIQRENLSRETRLGRVGHGRAGLRPDHDSDSSLLLRGHRRRV